MSGQWTPPEPNRTGALPWNPEPWPADPPRPAPSYPPAGGNNPTAAYPQPSPYPGGPSPYPGGPSPYPGGPSSYSGGPSPYPGAPGSYPAGPSAFAPAARPGRAPSVAGIAVASVGAALAVLGLFLNWYARGPAHAGVKELVQAAKLKGAPGFAHLYFGWALWVVLAVAIAVAISANLAGSSVAPLAIGGAVAGVGSTVLTYAALNAGRSSGSPFDHAAIGLWLFLLGPLILAAGALFALARSTARPAR